MSNETANLINTAVQEIIKQAQALGLTWTLRMATVTTASSANLTITFDGDTVAISATNITRYRLTSGDRVYCIMVPQSGNFIFGFATQLGITTNFNAVATAGTTVSATYVNMPGSPSTTFNKGSSSGTNLLVGVFASAFNSAISGLADIAVNIGGTDYQITRFFFNQANVHAHFGAQRLIPNITLGSKTVTARWLQAGAGTLSQDGSDWVSITVSEVPAP